MTNHSFLQSVSTIDPKFTMFNNPFETWNIFAKLANLGQFIFIATVLLRFHPKTSEVKLTLALCLCCSAYLLLTVPYSKEIFGQLRAVLFPFTEAMAFIVWALCYQLFDDSARLPKWPLVPLFIFTGALILQSMTLVSHHKFEMVHEVIHWIELTVLLHALYITYAGLVDDLLEPRRKQRFFVMLCIGCYIIMTALFEIFRFASYYDDLLRMLNALTVLIITTTVASSLFRQPTQTLQQSSETKITNALIDSSESQAVDDPVELDAIPVIQRPLFNLLMAHMETGHFKQPALTITQLAQQLDTPEHQLRKLINQHLNFSNFSSFLNSYRIKEACVRLQSISQAKTHILTIAIELGYGSTGPFNRAFKMVTGQTPTQYRQAYLDKQG